jgi:RNA polymerase sigma factor (TIGR02999 family)
MARVQPADLTRLLERWGDGDRAAMAELIPIVYGELRAMARRYLRGERPEHTIQSTALVHEAYLRLEKVHGVQWRSRAQFFAIAAQVMRHILVDHARARRAAKRAADLVPLDDALTVPAPDDLDLMALDRALTRLAAIDERKAKIVELRYFCGLSIDETADLADCSPTTVKREWTIAKAWLYRDMAG